MASGVNGPDGFVFGVESDFIAATLDPGTGGLTDCDGASSSSSSFLTVCLMLLLAVLAKLSA